MALQLDQIESAIVDHYSYSYALQLRPSPLFYLIGDGLFEGSPINRRRAYLKAKRRWYRDFRQEITWMRQGRN